jgi:hypothetical protein
VLEDCGDVFEGVGFGFQDKSALVYLYDEVVFEHSESDIT